jgi:hypothetical protein
MSARAIDPRVAFFAASEQSECIGASQAMLAAADYVLRYVNLLYY